MAVKIFLAAIAAISILQSVTALPSKPNQKLIDSGIKRHNKAMLNAQHTADNALRSMHEVANAVALQADAARTTSAARIASVEQRLISEISALGGDLASCTADQQEVIDALVQRLEVEVFTCVTDQVNDIAVIVSDVATLANKAVQLVRESTANLSVCLEHPLFAPTCIKEIVEVAEVEVEELAQALADDLEKAERILEEAPAAISDCAAVKLNAAGEEVQEIILDIAQCIVDGPDPTTEQVLQ